MNHREDQFPHQTHPFKTARSLGEKGGGEMLPRRRMEKGSGAAKNPRERTHQFSGGFGRRATYTSILLLGARLNSLPAREKI